ncbi:hypothetical protein CALVIDRAFT_568684 [Calocera viscosa TUFC12733]|uniref:Uncharacterized protein n=1 Tax=Calocera viscosa (strain TUFC12733) TaxID=1330018 RepID=A0A167GTY3_CALVF|nr:hypothetical protein CALVIDRAFT_568684 [Calocera viscosa TUFC12733]
MSSEPATAQKLFLWVYIDGDEPDQVFQVEITPNATIDALKHGIQHTTSERVLATVMRLEQYQDDVSMDPPQTLLSRLSKARSQVLFGHNLVSTTWPSSLDPNVVHVRVVHRTSEKRSSGQTNDEPPLKRARHRRSSEIRNRSPSPFEDLDALIARFCVKECESRLRTYFRRPDNDFVPRWSPPANSSIELQNHYGEVYMPLFDAKPSLLLHGAFFGDVVGPTIIERIGTDTHDVFVHGSPGSGKTAAALAVLMRKWGVFMTCRSEPDNIGSDDLSRALVYLKDHPDFHMHLSAIQVDDARVEQETQNRGSIQMVLLPCLLSRLSIMAKFLEEARDAGCNLPSMRRRWLCVQIFFMDAFGSDVFLQLSSKIRIGRFQTQQLDVAIVDMLSRIARLIDSEPLHVVLDEAQATVATFEDCLRSVSNQATRRPLLTGIMKMLSERLRGHRLVVAGTGLSVDAIETARSSVAAKNQQFVKFDDLGSFDDKKKQEEYLEKLLPKGPLFQEIVSYCSSYLRGRYRFTAAGIERVLKTGYQHPIQILTKTVECMTNGFVTPSPSLGVDDVADVARLWEIVTPPVAFDVARLDTLMSRSNPTMTLLQRLQELIWEWVLDSRVTATVSSDDMELLDHGFVRMKPFAAKNGHRIVTVDEPVIILAVLAWLRQQRNSPSYTLAAGMCRADPGSGNAFELAGVYFLASCFKSQVPLETLFEFQKDFQHPISEQACRLIAVNASSMTICEYNFEEKKVSSTSLGVKCSAYDETLQWLGDPSGVPICRPDAFFGADAILLIRTEDDMAVWALVQFKLSTKNILPLIQLQDGLKTICPLNIYSSMPKLKQDATQKMIQLQNMASSAPHRSNDLRVLSVMASIPASTQMSRVQHDKCKAQHAICCLKKQPFLDVVDLEKIISHRYKDSLARHE